MTYYRFYDPIRDADAYDRDQQRKLDECPHCDWCGEPIQTDYYYEIGEETICEDCIEGCRKRNY